MSQQELANSDHASELEVLAALPRSDEQSARKKLTVSFDADLILNDDRLETHSHSQRSSFLEQSWHRKDSSTRVKDSNKFISFHDIIYQVPVKKWLRKQPPKIILHGVRYAYIGWITSIVFWIFNSGMMKCGLNAIMGPSGSGKTRYCLFLMKSYLIHIHSCLLHKFG